MKLSNIMLICKGSDSRYALCSSFVFRREKWKTDEDHKTWRFSQDVLFLSEQILSNICLAILSVERELQLAPRVSCSRTLSTTCQHYQQYQDYQHYQDYQRYQQPNLPRLPTPTVPSVGLSSSLCSAWGESVWKLPPGARPHCAPGQPRSLWTWRRSSGPAPSPPPLWPDEISPGPLCSPPEYEPDCSLPTPCWGTAIFPPPF